jgi:hypothetical protein
MQWLTSRTAGVLRRRGPGRMGMFAVVTGLLAAVGVPGVVPSGALASSSPGLTWTKQHPATSPSARDEAAIASDAANGTVVLFGGGTNRTDFWLGDTWVWDGSTWTELHPAASPPALAGASMAYEAATGSVVLFGGRITAGFYHSGTWVWDGSTWAKQTTATHPSAREFASMAYDAATGTVVLFGGDSFRKTPHGTWVWDGTTWTKQHPATYPSARWGAAMAYDTATGTVVLFSGARPSDVAVGGTWVWGSN